MEKNELKINWRAQEARILRTSVNSLLQLVALVTATIEQFDGWKIYGFFKRKKVFSEKWKFQWIRVENFDEWDFLWFFVFSDTKMSSQRNRQKLKDFYKSAARESAELIRQPEINLDAAQFSKEAYVAKILRQMTLASLLDQEKSVGKDICELDHSMQDRFKFCLFWTLFFKIY